jgi:hypothetical protein
MTLEQRLEKLERENKWTRRIGAVGIAVAIGALAAAFLVARGPSRDDSSSQPDEGLPDLVVRSLTVKDEAGNSRIRLTAGLDGGIQRTALTLADQLGTRRIELSAGEHTTSLRLVTPDGKLLHNVQAVHSSRQFSEWTVHGPRDRMRSRLSLGADSAWFGFTDGSNRRVALDVGWDGVTGLRIFDAKGKVIWKAPED